MINAWNLIWIVPLSGGVGFLWAALCAVSSKADKAAERMNRSSENDN